MSEMSSGEVVLIDADTAIAAARAAAWDEGRECPTCEGNGSIPGGREIVHTRGGITGADWDLNTVEATIRNAEKVAWVQSWGGHDLAVIENGKQWNFAVKRPSEVRL